MNQRNPDDRCTNQPLKTPHEAHIIEIGLPLNKNWGRPSLFWRSVKSGRSRTEPENSGTPPWIGTLSWELGLCPPEHGSPSLAAALITCGGVESRLQRKGCDSDLQQNEAH